MQVDLVVELSRFVNSDAILNRDALWSIQGKNTIYKPLSLEEYTTQEKNCDERFLSYNRNISINFLSCGYGVMNF